MDLNLPHFQTSGTAEDTDILSAWMMLKMVCCLQKNKEVKQIESQRRSGLNWMECVKSRKDTNVLVKVGYSLSFTNIMTTAALRTGQFVTFDEKRHEVLAGGKAFKY